MLPCLGVYVVQPRGAVLAEKAERLEVDGVGFVLGDVVGSAEELVDAHAVELGDEGQHRDVGHTLAGQRPGTGGYDVYLQAAQTELQEAVRGRKEVAEADCAEVRFTEKSKAAARQKVREQ